MQLLLVRHAQPEVSSTLESARWPLSAAGRRAAHGLASRLPLGEKLWLSSQELKAVQTLQCLTDRHQEPILRDARFNEVHRHELFDDDFRSCRRAWVEGNMDARHTGWETPQEAASRYDEAIPAYAGQEDRL
ncbi:MAG: histidine phosphatase family protein, partial [Nocardioidaceae bacterium]